MEPLVHQSAMSACICPKGQGIGAAVCHAVDRVRIEGTTATLNRVPPSSGRAAHDELVVDLHQWDLEVVSR